MKDDPSPFQRDYPPQQGDLFDVEILRSEAMKRRISAALWARDLETRGVIAAGGDKQRIFKAVDDILEAAYLYIRGS